MRINRVVVNVICLFKSGLLYHLPELFSEIVVSDKGFHDDPG